MAAENNEGPEAGDDGSTRGNCNTDPSPPRTVPLGDLPPDFQKAMVALKRATDGETAVVKDRGNDVIVWLGEYDLHDYSEKWDEETAELYILVDKSFAHSDPHWVMMSPAVTVDGRDVGNIPSRNVHTTEGDAHSDKARMLTELPGVDSAIAFSWKWVNMNRKPDSHEDLADAAPLVEFLLTLEEDRRNHA
jgi:hypothetical protein